MTNQETEEVVFQINNGTPRVIANKKKGEEFSLVLKEGFILFTDEDGNTFKLSTQ